MVCNETRLLKRNFWLADGLNHPAQFSNLNFVEIIWWAIEQARLGNTHPMCANDVHTKIKTLQVSQSKDEITEYIESLPGHLQTVLQAGGMAQQVVTFC